MVVTYLTTLRSWVFSIVIFSIRHITNSNLSPNAAYPDMIFEVFLGSSMKMRWQRSKIEECRHFLYISQTSFHLALSFIRRKKSVDKLNKTLKKHFNKGKGKKGKVVRTPWRRRGSGCIDSHFLDLGTSWRWVVSFTPLPLYLRYPLGRRLDGPQSQSGWHGENSWLYRDSNSEPSVVQPVASRYTDSTISVLNISTNHSLIRMDWLRKIIKSIRCSLSVSQSWFEPGTSQYTSTDLLIWQIA
jgi:hypothetical protein